MVPRQHLEINGEEIEPKQGDRLRVEETNGDEATYEVMPQAPGEPAFRWSDTLQTVYRLHVKKVA